MRETRARSALKAVIWTFLGLIVMSGTGFLFTGSLAAAGAMGVLNAVLGFLSYLAYERVWASITWGLDASRG